ncbi:MAG TPA: hypothetical protein DDY78_12485 [Planctomycetales bacterium]|nr:hypothetical protein [Planctomycetales bacterium]
MPQICPKCHRANPADALYCYEDGFSLGGRVGASGPVDPGAQSFPHPFVFPDGALCRNFDQLALACYHEGAIAVELIRNGDLANFLAGLGRSDLAKAVREAARQEDKDRTLDQVLGQLPAKTIEPARLHVETLHVNMGQLTVGKDHRWELRLENQGMRMLSGTIACDDCVWLALGDGGGSPRKVFQFLTGTVIPVHVRGKLLRSAAKPMIGRLTIETNGGAATVVVTAEVPVKPFAEGVLAGAITPREIAQKARTAPKAAAALFESGGVARWYIQNGWTYPVQGPSASGIGAVQQYFEALGLTTPPKVEVRESSLFFEGKPGAGVFHTLDVEAVEKRPVFASAVSDQQWLKVSKIDLDGRTAHVRLAVDPVPDRPGESLEAKLTVRANGNQRFVVPIALRILGKPRTAAYNTPTVYPTFQVVETTPVVALPALPPALETAKPWTPPRIATWQNGAPSRKPAIMDVVPLDDEDQRPSAGPSKSRMRAIILPLLPVAFILLGLFVTLVRDMAVRVFAGGAEAAGLVAGPSGPPLIDVQFHDHGENVTVGTVGMKPADGAADDGVPAIWEPSMRFGLTMTGEADPLWRGAVKRLTFSEKGLTNNTCIKLDNDELLFGETGTRTQAGERIDAFRGRWKELEGDLGNAAAGAPRRGKRSVWSYSDEQIDVTQTVELVPGPQSGRLDTCIVRYRIDNRDLRPHTVGLRFLLDTFIGANDGVPFLIPGRNQLCDTHLDVQGNLVPLYIQACESDDLAHPGTIARIQFVLGSALAPPDRVTLGAWPNADLAHKMRDRRCRQQETLWEVPVYDISLLHDSAVVMYWNPKQVLPGASREMAFTYGLGDVAAGEGGGKLGLSVGGSFTPGGELSVTAYVNNPAPGQTVTLTLPDGFQLADGNSLTRPAPALDFPSASRQSPVTWTVKAGRPGDYTIKAESSNGAVQSKKVTIKSRSPFGDN